MHDLPACKSHLKFIFSIENTGFPNYYAVNRPPFIHRIYVYVKILCIMGSCKIVKKFIYLRVWRVWMRCGLDVHVHCVMLSD